MKKVNEMNQELISLNEELHSEFAVRELEQRLETDPLLLGGVVGAAGEGSGIAPADFCFIDVTEDGWCVIKSTN